jgi:hypothetical protein
LNFYVEDYSNYNSRSSPVFTFGDTLNSSAASNFIPIPELNTTDADLTLHFLSSSTKFSKPINDPWFLATQPWIDRSDDNKTYYVPEWPVNVFACTNRVQQCSVGQGKCTALASSSSASHEWRHVLKIDPSSRTEAVARRLQWYPISTLMANLGSSYLLAQAYNSRGYSTPLPDNQWAIEVQNWFGIMMTQLQRFIIDFVVGPGDPRYHQYVVPPAANDTWMCSAQIVNRSGYLSFSVLPVAIVLIVGVIAIVVNLSMEGLLSVAQKKSILNIGPSAEWKLTSLLQLQRMAFRGGNDGTWTGLHDFVPICDSGERFELSGDGNTFQLLEEMGSTLSQVDAESPTSVVDFTEKIDGGEELEHKE